MIYNLMLKLIKNANARYGAKLWGWDEYARYKAAQQHKLDVFYACDRFSEAQYQELTGLWLAQEAGA